MNGYQIYCILDSLVGIKYLFHEFLKNDTIPFELQLKRNGFFIANTSVEISSMGYWIFSSYKIW